MEENYTEEYTEEDYISNWSCVVCKLPNNFNDCDYLCGQFIEIESRLLFGRQKETYLKCTLCGALYHTRCINIEPKTIYQKAEIFVCSSCDI